MMRHMVAAEVFASERAFLVQLAYRMLGSVQDAEDVVQEAWLRWQLAGSPVLDVPRAWFQRACVRLCIDRIRAAARRPERYFGEWLPEPWVDHDGGRRDLDETLSQALLCTLQALSPRQRAVFLLHDVFRYEFEEIAAILDLGPANCRQLAARARKHIAERPRPLQTSGEVERLGREFFAALRDGDLVGLRSLLCEDVVLRADGGGKATAVHYPLVGCDRVLRFFDRIFVRTGLHRRVVTEQRFWNGSPGVTQYSSGGQVEAAYQFEVADGRIAAIRVQRNPDKLRRLRAP